MAEVCTVYVPAKGTIIPTEVDIKEVREKHFKFSDATEGLSTDGTNAAGDPPGLGKTPPL